MAINVKSGGALFVDLNEIHRAVRGFHEVGRVSSFLRTTDDRSCEFGKPSITHLAFALVGGKSLLAHGPVPCRFPAYQDVGCGGDTSQSATDGSRKQSSRVSEALMWSSDGNSSRRN
jgi:hypothetical protein